MKICWDNLEGLFLNSKGNFQKGVGNIYIYIDSCAECREPFLTVNSNRSKYCCRGCAQTGKRNNMFGRGMSGKDNPSYRHGLYNRRLPSFHTYGDRLLLYEEVLSLDGVLAVRCAYCGNYFVPKLSSVVDRIRFIENGRKFESKFYCSNNCKNSCPVYNKKKYPKGFKKATAREVQPELRQLVFKRDNYACIKCGRDVNTVRLHCHHIEGIAQNPIESADLDNCVTLCEKCHRDVHKEKGCYYYDFRCREEDKKNNEYKSF